MLWTTLILLAYLLGSVPTGVLIGRFRGVDPRAAGSRNTGASNVARTMGALWGGLTLVVDVSKAALATYLGLHYGGTYGLACVCGFVAVLGHCYSVWMRFTGGKGVASAFGVVAVLLPVVAVVAALVWSVLLAFTRTPAIGSMVAAILFVVLPHAEANPFEIHGLTFSLAVVLVIRHRKNLAVLKERIIGNPRGSRKG